MLVDSNSFGFLSFLDASFGIKAFLLLFLVFYIFFSVILYRQIVIMNRKLPTPLSPLLRFMGIVHIGVSVAVFFLVLGNFS
ncbi:MAG: hypothetical protein UU23_C0006G0005 [Candidatus Curtissbacteria bacterium GW2011_GWA1_40_9]|uniref:Uncharacterized protein n=1 Tax=Candidatus Curtissbacteria bacterium GW2011_GWA1_40_9 TaxID=1618408 RepID=A0A0G0W0T5_9BACT|nr:MAG: hypothetical protein UU23_C0006G0005 [Candidatus Curtissbacteria bacterium GW2011_GWA1_40_9]